MQDELVEKNRWISNGRFLHALSHCMLLPGPEAQQLAIYIGWKLHGKRGGIVAGTLFVLPSMFALLALSMAYVRFGSLPWIAAMFNGLKPVVIAVVIVALQRVARRALRGPVQGATAVATFAAMFFFNVSLLVIMVGHSTGGGEMVHYLARHGQSRVAKAAILSAVPPLMVKSAANPGGLPKEVFDGLQAQLAGNRAQFYYDLPAGPLYGPSR